MKRKFILLPITLTALAPAISLVGCGGDEPESEYINVEIKNNTSIDSFPLYKNKCYKFYNDA
ncbi:MAG: hypothetical protein MJ200_03215 [Mycoplasmoidaceae bacterium]|nr:hypothetical protein [Mycoplasmoidaceae bacterium]